MKLRYFGKAKCIVMTLAIATLAGVMSLGADVGSCTTNWNQLQKARMLRSRWRELFSMAELRLPTANVNLVVTGQSDDGEKSRV